MLKIVKALLAGEWTPARTEGTQERHHLHVSVASLLHEATRVDLSTHDDERTVAEGALADLFGLSREQSVKLFAEGREKALHLTSYFGPVSVAKRDMTAPERARLIEHMWRVAYADGGLDPYEDHYVRKLGHLLYVPNTEIMLARNRARERQ
jgi:uncharacterized tellurite resistance protein B-like protein